MYCVVLLIDVYLSRSLSIYLSDLNSGNKNFTFSYKNLKNTATKRSTPTALSDTFKKIDSVICIIIRRQKQYNKYSNTSHSLGNRFRKYPGLFDIEELIYTNKKL